MTKIRSHPPGRSLPEIRWELQSELEALQVFGQKLFELSINVEKPPASSYPDS